MQTFLKTSQQASMPLQSACPRCDRPLFWPPVKLSDGVWHRCPVCGWIQPQSHAARLSSTEAHHGE